MPKKIDEEHVYRERIYPRLGTFFVIGLFIVMISIAYAAAIDTYIGLVIFIVGILGMLIGLWFSSPTITISGKQGTKILSVAQATIPLDVISHPRILEVGELAAIRRGQIASTAFITIRGNLPSVAVTVIDPDDPHEMWVISSRRSKELRDHLDSAPFHDA